MALLLASSARADDVADVSKLLRAGQYVQAIKQADAFLVQHPRDAQMRFLKGVILTEQNKSADAITIFSKLTEDFPELPEPYNNLAVLYAANGQYDKARTALDKAIRTNPTYATAYENLGDVHAKLASQAYDKALQLDSANSGAKSKLTLVRSLVAGTVPSGGTKIATAPVTTKPIPAPPATAVVSAPAASAPAASVTVAVKPAPAAAAANSKVATAAVVPPTAAKPVPVAPAPAVAVPAKPVPTPPAPTVIAKATPAKTEPAKPAHVSPSNANADRDAVLSAVNGWAKAWSAQDVKSYLNFYGNDFETPNGLTRKAWTEERQARIAGKGRITVKAESPQVTVSGNTATVKFRQTYVSDRLTVNSRKTLVLTKAAGKWQIKQERTGS